jgi:hypothetical protein
MQPPTQNPKNRWVWLHTYRGFTWFNPQKFSRCAQPFLGALRAQLSTGPKYVDPPLYNIYNNLKDNIYRCYFDGKNLTVDAMCVCVDDQCMQNAKGTSFLITQKWMTKGYE